MVGMGGMGGMVEMGGVGGVGGVVGVVGMVSLCQGRERGTGGRRAKARTGARLRRTHRAAPAPRGAKETEMSLSDGVCAQGSPMSQNPIAHFVGVLHMVLGVLHRVLGVLRRVVGVLHRVVGVLHRVLRVVVPLPPLPLAFWRSDPAL